MMAAMLRRLLRLPIRCWQLCLAPLLPPMCRFYPSCSAYALEALERHSAPRALGLILWRIVRCQPFCAGGYDPVPPARGSCGTHGHVD